MFAIIDCNNFYASCERLFNPSLRNQPLIILSNNDGCVIARSNEAKALGIKMGEPAFKIEPFLNKHKVAVYSSNYALYGDISERVMNTISTLIPNMEIYSIDEAFLDLSGFEDIEDICLQVKQRVEKWAGIPVSIGVAPTKTLAKVANHKAKKEPSFKGICILNSVTDIQLALNNFPINEVWGIGRKHTQKLEHLKIKTAAQFCALSENYIKQTMTVVGLRTQKELKGMPCIKLDSSVSPKKSICNARSFGKTTSDKDIISEAVANYASRCAEKLRKQNSCSQYITVFLETNRFRLQDKQYFAHKTICLPLASNRTPDLIKYALHAFNLIYKKDYTYKKAGVIVSEIIPEKQIQLNLFEDNNTEKLDSLMKLMDNINKNYGNNKLRIATQGYDRKWKLRQEKLSPCYTSRWDDILNIKI